MPLKKLITIREALEDDALLGKALPGDTWLPHRALLIAAMGEELTAAERTVFTAITGREREPMEQVDELVAVLGRRAGKTRSAGTLAAFVACLCDHAYLAAGERAVIPILAGSTIQAANSFQAVLGVIEESPLLSKQVETSNTETIKLSNRCDLVVRTASFRTIRGLTSPLVCADEVSTWYNDEHSANADVEILNAARPALGTTGGLLYMYSSPWAKRGELWTAYRKNFGPNGDPTVLVAKGPSRTFNPTLPQRVVDRAYDKDAFRAAAEYGAEFRDGISQLLTADIIDAAIDHGTVERPPEDGENYVAFVDPSGGSNDSFTLAIAHGEKTVAVIDAIRERKPPFSPEAVVSDFCDLLALYRIKHVTGDRYAGEWPREQFRKRGVEYRLSQKTASEIFNAAVPLFNSKTIAITESATVVRELAALERRTSRGGRDQIGHPPGGHDDVAVSVCGAALLAVKPQAPALMLAAPEFIKIKDGTDSVSEYNMSPPVNLGYGHLM